MIMVVLAVLVAVSVPLAGGRLSRLGALQLRGAWLLVVALALQVVIISIIPDRLEGIHAPAHILSYLLGGAFFVLNRAIYGLWLVGLGGALNLLVIAANGGVMPIRTSATSGAGGGASSSGFANAAPIENPRLAFLGDVIALPESWPLSNVLSVGDLVLVLGLFVVLHANSGSRLSRFMPGALRSQRRTSGSGCHGSTAE